MEIETEIREIFSNIRLRLKAYQEIGFEPPAVAVDAVDRSRPAVSDEPAAPLPKEAGTLHDPVLAVPPLSLQELRDRIGDCRRCRLHENRTHLVFGEGAPKARLVFVGEGPGHDEDRVGRPFVGESGKLLTRIIENGMGLTRDDVYICNVVKCHPPQNRDPQQDEVASCIPFLREQLRIIGPEVICSLGRVAAQALLGREFKIRSERGTWRAYEGVPLMPTYHPAYLLRTPSAKRDVWEDIKKVMKRIGLEVKKHG